ncbi:MAG: fatty acid desaturase [Bacteroidota bacterium]
MVKDKELILATAKYAQEDRSKSWTLMISTLILWMLAYAGAIVNVHIVPQIIFAVLAALLNVRFFIIYHDYAHKSLLQNSILADIVFYIFGLFILAPVSIWKRSHNFHHAHNSKLYSASIGSYPIATREEFIKASKLERRLYLFARHPFTIMMGYVFVFIWGMVLRSLINNPKKHLDSLLSLVFHGVLITTIVTTLGWQSLLIGYFLPIMIAHAMGAYLFYAQHNFPSVKFKNKEEWNYVDAALKSSSYMTMNKLMHWFTGNIGYHHIHHINPRIPFYNLPKAFREMEIFQNPGTTSLSLKGMIECFKLKVWDPELDRMIGKMEIYR